jgi:D-xylose transport system ATP-binding protein
VDNVSRLVAIARAMYFNAKILIMDEPTAELGPQEPAMVAELIKQLKKEGMGIFLVSRDSHDVFDLSDRVSVLKNGELVGTHRTRNVSEDDILGMIILGKQPDRIQPAD